MKIKSLFLSLVFLATGGSLFAQNVLPNVSFNASLNSTCSTPNSFCTNSVLPTNPGVTGNSGSALDVSTGNYAVATVTVSGTYAGATVNFDFSDPTGGTAYFQELCARTDVNILELSEALPSNQTRAWQCPVIATTRFRVRVSAISSGSINCWITITQTAIDPSPTAATLPQPSTQPASSFSSSVQATLTASVNVKATTGNVYGVSAVNGAASVCWVQFINSSGAGTLGTGVVFAIALPASGVVNVGPGDIALGNFSSGIAVGIATTPNGSTACGTAGNLTVFYQ